MIDKDSIKVYIRHCGERTLPLLQWIFRGYKVELLDGTKRPFTEVYEENLIKMHEQDEEWALTVDGDTLPIIPLEKIIQQLIEPMQKDSSLITTNGVSVEKFVYWPTFRLSGFKPYKPQKVHHYLKSLDKNQIRPESHLYKKVGGFYQYRGAPQCGHEFGQYLHHIYEKAYFRGLKTDNGPRIRYLPTKEFKVFRDGFLLGKKEQQKAEVKAYNPNNLPKKYRKFEKSKITDFETDYNKIKNIMNLYIRFDIFYDRTAVAVKKILKMK